VDKAVWVRLSGFFENVRLDVKKEGGLGQVMDSLREKCMKAGKRFYEMLDAGMLKNNPCQWEVPARFEDDPVGSRDDIIRDGRGAEEEVTIPVPCYHLYWLLVLREMSECKQNLIDIRNYHLRHSGIPRRKVLPDGSRRINWKDVVYSEKYYDNAPDYEGMFIENTDYMESVCESSKAACKILAECIAPSAVTTDESPQSVAEDDNSGKQVSDQADKATTSAEQPLVVERPMEPDTAEGWIVLMYQQRDMHNEKLIAEGKPPLKGPPSYRDIATYIKSKGIEISHTTVSKLVKELSKLGLLNAQWDMLDSVENKRGVRLDSVSTVGEIFRSPHAKGQRKVPEDEENA